MTRNSSVENNTVIHILHVDDDSSILEISKDVLEEMGNFEIDQANCVDDALKKLATNNYDVVVSDYEMPQKDGLILLKELRGQKKYIPFILFTGKGREEIAIKALNLGADGYHNKQGDTETVFGELSHSIKLVFCRNKAALDLQESEKRYRLLADNTSDVIWTMDLDGHFTYVSPSVHQLRGYKPEEVTKQSIIEALTPESAQIILEGMEAYKKTGIIPSSRFEIEQPCKDGSKVLTEVSFTLLYDEDGKPYSVLGVSRDITQRKKAEDELKQKNEILERVTESLDSGLAIIGRDYHVVWANKLLRRLCDDQNKKCFEVFNKLKSVCPDCGVKKIFEQNLPLEVHEFKAVNSTSEVTWVELRVTPLRDKKGNVIAALELAVPINERKKVEEETNRLLNMIQKSEDQMRAIIANAPIGIAISDFNMIFLSANEKFCKILGYSEEELQKLTFKDITHSEDAPKSIVKMEELISGQIDFFNQEKRYVRKDGTIIDGKIMVSAIRDKEDTPVLFIAELEDISEEKEVRKSLVRSEKLYSDLYEQSPLGYQSLDAEGRIINVNRAWLELLGYGREEVIGHWFGDFLEPSQTTLFRERFPIFKTAGKTFTEFKLKRKDDSTRLVAFTCRISHDSKGQFKQTHCVLQDITDRNEAENQLKISEERYKQLFSKMPSGVAVYEAVNGGEDFIIQDFNKAAEIIERFSCSEVIGKRVTEVFPGVKDLGLFAVLQKVYQTGVCEFLPTSHYNDSRTLDSWRENWVYKLPNGNLVAIYDDVTEQKKMLIELEETARLLSENPAPVLRISIDGRLLYANPASQKLLKEFELKIGYLAPKAFSVNVKKAVSSKAPLVFEVEFADRLYEFKVIPVLSEGYVNLYAADMTENYKAHMKLKKSEQKYLSLFENSLDGIVIAKRSGKILSANPAFCNMLGMTEEEVKDVGRQGIVINDERNITALKQQDAMGKVVAQLSLKRKDNSVFEAEISSKVFIDSDSSESLLVSIRDSSNRLLSGLLNTARSVLDIEDFPVSARKIFDTCKHLIGATTGFIALLSDDGTQDKILFVDTDRVEAPLDFTLSLPLRGIRKYVYETKKIVCENNFSGSKWKKLMPSGHPNLQNAMIIPLIVKERVLGLVGLANKPSDFTEEDESVALGFADYVAFALVDSLKLTAIQNQEKALEMVNEKLRVVGGLTRHDICNKLGTVKANLYLLEKRLGENPEIRKCLERIDSALGQSNEIIEFSRLYERVGSQKLAGIDVEKAFDNAIRLVSSQEKIEVINQCQSLIVKADSLLEQLFYNLIDNSLKHGEKVTQIRLHFKKDKDCIRLFYDDDGIGIPKLNKSKLFEEGFTTGRGTGLGLKLIKRMVDVYGWSINEEGIPGEGAKFIITIPKIIEKRQSD